MRHWAWGAGAALCIMAGCAEAADAIVRIGVLNDMSSVYSDAGGRGAVEAAIMAAEDAGPVLGHKVEVIFADHQNKPDVGSAIARQWYERDGVDVLVNVPNSAVGFAVQELSRNLHKPALFTGALSSEITGTKCSPYSAQWVYDTYTLSKVIGSAVVKQGGDTWFFIGADYTFGRSLVRETTAVVERNGGKVLGAVFAPLAASDFSSFLLQAQSSKAKIIGLANSAGDTVNTIKQGAEFGILAGGQKFAGFVVFVLDVHALGLKVAQGMLLTTAFYWDQNDETRAFARRYMQRVAHPPTWDQAGTYSAVNHYLKAIKALGSKDADTVMAKMRDTPIEDFMTRNGKLRIDGRVVRDMYLYEVKKPEDSTGEWDLYRLVATIPGDEAVRPLNEGGCPLVTGQANR
jgi:branched-chain amino acid transport system substrate-binding protein